jgi:hypothetical protein
MVVRWQLSPVPLLLPLPAPALLHIELTARLLGVPRVPLVAHSLLVDVPLARLLKLVPAVPLAPPAADSMIDTGATLGLLPTP